MFSTPHPPLSKGGSKAKQQAITDKTPNSKDPHPGGAAEASPEEKRGGYVRPGERKSGNVLLISGILGAVAIAAVTGAVIVSRNRGHALEQVKSTEPTEKKDAALTLAPEKPVDGKKDTAATPKHDAPTATKDEPTLRPANSPVVMLALPRAVRSFSLRAMAAKPESIQNTSGTPISVDVPFERVRQFFAPENRTTQDAVVVWLANTPVDGKGERIAVDTYSATTGVRVGRFEYDGDGTALKCDVSPDGRLFAAAVNGKIAVWNLADKTMPLDGFDPYADKPDHRKAGLAAVYFASNSTNLVTVSTAGAIHLFDIATRKPLADLILPNGHPGRVVMGKSVAADGSRASVVVEVGGVIHQVATNAGLRSAWTLELGGEVGHSFGIAAVGAGPHRLRIRDRRDQEEGEGALILSAEREADRAPLARRGRRADRHLLVRRECGRDRRRTRRAMG